MISVCRVVYNLGNGERLKGVLCDKRNDGDIDGEARVECDVDPKLVKELTEMVLVFVSLVLRALNMFDGNIVVDVIVDGDIEENVGLMAGASVEEAEADKELEDEEATGIADGGWGDWII